MWQPTSLLTNSSSSAAVSTSKSSASIFEFNLKTRKAIFNLVQRESLTQSQVQWSYSWYPSFTLSRTFVSVALRAISCLHRTRKMGDKIDRQIAR